MNQKKVNWQAVFFDFDGVIADSTQVKTDAFSGMFRQYGQEVEAAVIHHHLTHGGISRLEKIDFYYRQYLGQEPGQATLERLGKEFSEMVVDRVVEAPFIEGALESLEVLRTEGVPAFVISGTPHEEMELIVERKKLQDLFREVHGSPPAKTAIALDILKRHTLDSSHCLFIGDALADHKAAMETGMHFLGITFTGSPVIFPPDVVTSSFVKLSLHI